MLNKLIPIDFRKKVLAIILSPVYHNHSLMLQGKCTVSLVVETIIDDDDDDC